MCRRSERKPKRTIERFALSEVVVLRLSDESGFEATDDAFEVSTVRVEEESLHCGRRGGAEVLLSAKEPNCQR